MGFYRGLYRGLIVGDGVMKGDARSLDYSSYSNASFSSVRLLEDFSVFGCLAQRHPKP